MFTMLTNLMTNDKIDDSVTKNSDCVIDDSILCLYDNEYAVVDIQSFIQVYKFANHQHQKQVFEVNYDGHNIVAIMSTAVRELISKHST